METYIYIGETSKNTQMRFKSKQHMEDMHRNSEDSVLMRYRREKHEGREIPFEMKVVASFLHDPLAIQCAEAIWIKKVDYDKRINNKTVLSTKGYRSET